MPVVISGRLLLTVLLLLAGYSVPGLALPKADPQLRAFLMFAGSYSQPIKSVETSGDCSDLGFLVKFTGDARLIGIGEERHSAHEFLQLKRRFVECLVSRQGFRGVLIEAGLPYTAKLNAYIREGKGDVDKLVDGMAYWSLYENDEFIALLKWLKDFNSKAKAGDEVNILGIDMQDPQQGIEAVEAYMLRVDPGFVREMQHRAGDFSLFGETGNVMARGRAYKALSEKDYKALSAKLALVRHQLESHRAQYIAKSGEADYLLASEFFHTVEQGHEMYSLARDKQFGDMFAAREQAMLENVKWQMANGGDKTRYVLLSHNNHVAKSTIYSDKNGEGKYDIEPLGMSLARTWPDKYLAIGMTFYRSPALWQVWQNDAAMNVPDADANTLDAALASTGDALYFLDFRNLAPGSPAEAWANQKHYVRRSGAGSVLEPVKAFDGIVFVRDLYQANYTKAAKARFDKIGPPRPSAVKVSMKDMLQTQGDYRLPNDSVVEFRVLNETLYVFWNNWRFKTFAQGPDRYSIRTRPETQFRFEQDDTDKHARLLRIRQGDKPWQETERLQ